jgi:hypothetical protein
MQKAIIKEGKKLRSNYIWSSVWFDDYHPYTPEEKVRYKKNWLKDLNVNKL